MKSFWGLIFLLCTLVLASKGANLDDVKEDEEEGDVEEDLTSFTKDELVMFKTLWKLRDCAGPAEENDNVTMIIEYTAAKDGGGEQEVLHTLTTPVRRSGLKKVCLGEKRRVALPRAALEEHRARELLPGLVEKDTNWIDVEVVGINDMTFTRMDSGLQLSVLEPVAVEYCNQTVEEGDTLYVDYEGTLEDGTVFDSSAARNAPFGPFEHGRGQIIQGYTDTLTGRCLGERWRMVVPPHLAYGNDGAGDVIPGGATLTFDVRLVQHNQMRWNDEVKKRKVFKWEQVHKPEKCSEVTKVDELYIHYEATREDGAQFGSIPERYPPYGPFSLQADGKTGVPGIDLAIPGMCLGEKRLVTVPPRMGWTKNNAHHDTIRVLLHLVSVNGEKISGMEGPGSRRGETGDL